MPKRGEPDSIQNNQAGVFSADLLYEQNCKCGTTEVLIAEGSWSADTDDERVWKIHVVNAGHASNHKNVAFTELTADNISSADCTKIVEAPIPDDTEIMGSFSLVTAGASEGTLIVLYKDCKLS